MQELLITNIQRMSFHDGPGMRTTVFLKGCNLRCAWCHNPETQNPQPELIFRAQRCVRCGTCVHSCASGARTMGPEGPARDTARCVGCGRCAQACLTGAIDVAGRRISCQELTELVLRDEKIFRTTAGGVTCSGGEPLLQADAVAELLGGMHARGLHTCVDTAGNVPWEAFEQVLPVTDLFLYDVKAYSPQTHRQWTGVGNERILENLRRLAARADIWIRIPFVPGVNTEQIEDIGRFLTQLPRVRRVEILPYHTLGAEKSAELNRVQRQFPVPDAAACETAEQTLRMLGLPVTSGRDRKRGIRNRMKGLVVEAAGKICLREDLPLPEIDAYQVLCRNVGCGICNGTDMQLINGQMPFIQYPFVLGHEAVGQVVAVGEKVRSFQEGDYILRSALPGLPGYHSFWGGFAEYGVADDYAARLADHAGADIETSTRQLVPAGIDPVEATMLITLKEVASALHRLRLQPGQNVVVAGCGPVGIAMAALAKCMGAGKVVLAGHHPARIAAAKRLGADLAFDTREQPLADTVRGYMPEGVDLYIDAVGNPNLLMDGMRLIRQEGTIGLYGLGLRADAAIDWSLLPHNCILQTVQWPIAAQESAVHDEVCGYVTSGRLPLREFVTHKIPVEDFAEGLRLVRGREGIKIALTF